MKDSLVVFSNCDEVELFNGVNGQSLGKKSNPGLGYNFQWDQVDIQYNVLKAIGYVDGKAVAEDMILLHHLPDAPEFEQLYEDTDLLTGLEGFEYLYRVNAGGPDYTDQHGQLWMADVPRTEDEYWGSVSWTNDFKDLPAFYASQRRIHDPIKGTKEWELFQNFRFGKHKLKFEFPLPDGEYLVELYFNEPWYGTGGGMDAEGWRDFDVAISGDTVLQNLDIWKEVGHDHALKKTVKGKAKNGLLTISFPKITAGQALISGIAIASPIENPVPVPSAPKNILALETADEGQAVVKSWLDNGQDQYLNSSIQFNHLPYQLFGADWIRFSADLNDQDFNGSFEVQEASNVFVLLDEAVKTLPEWMGNFEKTKGQAVNSQRNVFEVYQKKAKAGQTIQLGQNGQNAQAMYSVVVVPTYTMGEGDEARPVVTQEAELAKVSGEGIEKGNFKKSDYIAFSENNRHELSWEVNPGLAGIYLIRFRYMNVADHPIKVRLQIEADNGVMMRDEEITFPVKDEKWKILNTTTGSMINAGKYTIRISADDMGGLWMDRMEFQ